MVYEEPKRWHDFLSLPLWAYPTLTYIPTEDMHSSLVYEVTAVVPIKLMVSLLDYLMQNYYLIFRSIYMMLR